MGDAKKGIRIPSVDSEDKHFQSCSGSMSFIVRKHYSPLLLKSREFHQEFMEPGKWKKKKMLASGRVSLCQKWLGIWHKIVIRV